jgi:hypothetical protein
MSSVPRVLGWSTQPLMRVRFGEKTKELFVQNIKEPRNRNPYNQGYGIGAIARKKDSEASANFMEEQQDKILKNCRAVGDTELHHTYPETWISIFVRYNSQSLQATGDDHRYRQSHDP